MNWRKQTNSISFITSNSMRFLMILQHKTNLSILSIICQIHLDFHPRNEVPSCLKGGCGCVNTKIHKKCLRNIFNYILKNKVLKNPTFILLRGLGDPSLIFPEIGYGKTKPNRWVERFPKMRNLCRCYC